MAKIIYLRKLLQGSKLPWSQLKEYSANFDGIEN